MKKKFPTYIEETAQLYDTIMVSAGQRGVQVTVSPEDLREYVDGTFVGLVQVMVTIVSKRSQKIEYLNAGL